MYYKIISRDTVNKFLKKINCKTLVISITDPGKPEVEFIEKPSVKVLRLSYHYMSIKEIENQNYGDYGTKIPLTIDQAYRIKHCIEARKDKLQLIVVQGELGISRSAGIMAAIREWLEGDDGGLWADPRYRPDLVSYTVLTKAISGEDIDIDTKRAERNELVDQGIITAHKNVDIQHFPKQTYITGAQPSMAKCVGYCWLYKHRGYLNKSLLEEHQCIEKHCPLLQRFDDHPLWVHRAEVKKHREKIKEKQKTEEQTNDKILQVFREATSDIDDFAVCGVEHEGDAYVMRCASLHYINLWHAIEDVQEKLGIYVKVKFIRNTYDIRAQIVDKYLSDPHYLHA